MYLAALKSNSDHKYFLFVYVFTYFWLYWIFIVAHWFALVQQVGVILCSSTLASCCSVFFCWGAWIYLPHGMWACGIFLDQGTDPCSFPALEGGFLTTGLPRKSDCQPQNRESKEFKHFSVITCKFYFKKLILIFIMINSINIYNT